MASTWYSSSMGNGQNPFGKEFEDTLMRKPGDKLFNEGKISEAKNFYWMVIKTILCTESRVSKGGTIDVPSLAGPEGTVVSKKYQALDLILPIQLAGCYTGLIRCCLKEKDIETALMWLEEMEAMWMNHHLTAPVPLYDYMHYNMHAPEVTYQRVLAWTSLSDAILTDLGNTSLAFWYRWKALTHFNELPSLHHTPAVQKMNDVAKMRPLMLLRHPDPHVYAKFNVKNERLQINGSWRRIRHRPPPGNNKMKRSGFSSFIWNGHLYLGGGREDVQGPYFRDLWCLDLNKPTTGGWRKLPDYPLPFSVTNIWLGWNFSLDPFTKRAYLFNGLVDVDYFDLVTEQWGRIKCSYIVTPEDKKAGVTYGWPYPGRQTSDYTSQIVFRNNEATKILVFGGTHELTNMGCNLFMELDMKTKKWRRISGTMNPTKDANHSCPGPRKYGGSWLDGAQKHFYLMYGNFDRHLFDRDDEHHKSEGAHTCTDYWVYDIDAEKWRRERIRGNPPPPRTEFGVTFASTSHSQTTNPHLNKVFVFGGYSSSFTTSAPQKGRQFNYAYFADTFMLDLDESENIYVPPSTPDSPPPNARQIKHAKWRQVLTPGFPTYRCHGQLLTDLDTGKMYMIGGFTNDDWMSEGNEFTTTSFGDLWQLRVNLPGGFYSDVNVEEEWKTAKAGPWRRCFACGSAGLWKKCGGSCGGKAYFCDNECLKEGWRAHKKMHKCAKK